jgi:hypothetical protein
VISATVREAAGDGAELGDAIAELGVGLSGAAAMSEDVGDAEGVGAAHPAASRTSARGMANRRVQAFMALIRAAFARG